MTETDPKNSELRADDAGPDAENAWPEAIQLVRDPRDFRELLTDVLGVTLEASNEDARKGIQPSARSENALGRRKREKAWRDLQSPAKRLVEEALLYPLEPIPQPEDEEFPAYQPDLPPVPQLHRTEDALGKLLAAVREAIPAPDPIPDPTLRLDEEPPLPPLPDPSDVDV